MTRRRAGFTLIELLVVILIGSVLVGIALSGFNTAQAAFRARGAKTMYATLHQRARARAIEMGRSVTLMVDVLGDSAMIVDYGAGQFTDVTNFREELNVDLRAPQPLFQICMTPRGYADPTCPGLPLIPVSTTSIRLEFWLNADSTSVLILPMGQLVGM